MNRKARELVPEMVEICRLGRLAHANGFIGDTTRDLTNRLRSLPSDWPITALGLLVDDPEKNFPLDEEWV